MKNLNNIGSANGAIEERNWCFGAKRGTVKTGHQMRGPTIFREYSRGSNRCFSLITSSFFMMQLKLVTVFMPAWSLEVVAFLIVPN